MPDDAVYPDMTSAQDGTRPPDLWASHREHWLRSARGAGMVAAVWTGEEGRWELPGEAGGVMPAEVNLRGWRWSAPAFPPNDAALDPEWIEKDSGLLFPPTDAGAASDAGLSEGKGEDGPAQAPEVLWRPESPGVTLHGFFSAEELRSIAGHMDRHSATPEGG